ncbi:MAG: metalloendopeptidase, partial [Planctomycetaceae bacterium]
LSGKDTMPTMFARRLDLALTFAVFSLCAAAASLTHAQPTPADDTASTMVRDSLHREAQAHFDAWRQNYEARTNLDEVAAYQTHLRSEFTQRIGGLPRPKSLNAQVTGTIQRRGYTVEKILFESQPQFYVTGALFLPDPQKFPPPWPAVLVVCGHSTEGKQQLGYQSGTALAALHGLAAMIVDPVGQGERMQLLKPDGTPAIAGTTTEHSLLGTGAILVGWNTARWMIADGMAAIDYLQSRDDIQADRIGCMGNSGGGTQTSYLMALDERVTAAAPSCYITSFKRLLETIGPQDAEQNIYGQIALGMDHADYLMMRAPKPTLIACATKDFFDIDGTWGAFRDAKRLFQRFGAGRNIELVEVDATHGWHPMIRQASVQFMVEHLAGRIAEVSEPEIETLTVQEMNVTPEGQVLRLPQSLSAFDHVRQESERLAKQRETNPLKDDDLRRAVRELAVIRELAQLPKPVVDVEPQTSDSKQPYQRVKLRINDDVYLPGLLAVPQANQTRQEGEAGAKRVTCFVLEEGKDIALEDNEDVEQRVSKGETVLLLDLRGTGETKPAGKPWYHQRFGANGGNSVLAYLLGKSLVGARAEDCLVAVRWLAEHTGVEQVQLVASGELTIPALHAAALEPQWFASVELRGGIDSWSEIAAMPLSENQVAGLVHGALRSYDLPDLAKLLGDRLLVRSQDDAVGKPDRRR